jgi:hypothetical protein
MLILKIKRFSEIATAGFGSGVGLNPDFGPAAGKSGQRRSWPHPEKPGWRHLMAPKRGRVPGSGCLLL